MSNVQLIFITGANIINDLLTGFRHVFFNPKYHALSIRVWFVLSLKRKKADKNYVCNISNNVSAKRTYTENSKTKWQTV